MEPLRQLRDTITDFGFHYAGRSRYQWAADHFDLFRSLPHLTRLDIFGVQLFDRELELLTADPAPTIGNSQAVRSSRTLNIISRLTSLFALNVNLQIPVDEPIELSVLGRLTCLETLHLTVKLQLNATQMVAALKTCTAITDLSLDGCRRLKLTDAHLCDLFPALTRLRRLDLRLLDKLDDLSCLSVASNLADTLEHIRVEHHLPMDSLPPHTLVHLRTLRRLQSADIATASRRTDTVDTRDTNDSDSETISLPMLEDLRITIHGEGDVDLRGMLGRLPQLRVVRITCEYGSDIDVPPLLHFLAHAPALTKLDVHHPALTDAHLCTLMPSLPHLRDLAIRGLALTSLRFASSSSRLAHSLENLDIIARSLAPPLPPNELVHLRSLGALRHLHPVLKSITLAAEDHSQPHSNCSDSGAASLAALTNLHVDVEEMQSDALGSLKLDLSVLGPMPQLEECKLLLNSRVQVASIARALAHSTQLVDLDIIHPAITDEHLVELMPHLPHLRSLDVSSRSHLGALSFASPAVAPRLSATLTRLTIRTTDDTTPMKPSDLHPLRALASLTSLRLQFPQSRRSLAAELEEMTLTSQRFVRDCWPRLREADIDCK